MYYIVAYLLGAAIPEEISDTETLDALEEAAEMVKLAVISISGELLKQNERGCFYGNDQY